MFDLREVPRLRLARSAAGRELDTAGPAQASRPADMLAALLPVFEPKRQKAEEAQKEAVQNITRPFCFRILLCKWIWVVLGDMPWTTSFILGDERSF